MPIFDTGERTPGPHGETGLALTRNGARVLVKATAEAVEAYEWATIMWVASDKYDCGEIAAPGPPPIVIVTADECCG